VDTVDGGSLKVSARYADGRLAAITVDLRRPPVAGFFADRPPAQVVHRVPLLFSLCAGAQKAAAAAALAAAGGGAAPPVDDRALWTECLHEHLWRLFIDWPRLLGIPDAATAFAAWRRARGTAQLADVTAAMLAAAVDGGVIEKCRGALVDRGGPPVAPETPAPEAWLRALRDSGAALPAPVVPPSAAAAYAQRVAGAQAALAGLRDGAPYPAAAAGGSGFGVGQAATARGMLTHAAEVRDGRVVRYRIWAPTDRNFSDAGPLIGLMEKDRWPDAGAARRALEIAVLALDPCLPWQVEVAHA
jgi:hypothetical protein